MVLKGGDVIHTPREEVWDIPTDRNQIGQCIPGAEKIETVAELKKYRGNVSVGPGSLKACSNGDIKILDLDQPNRAKLKAHSTVSERHPSDGPDGSTLVLCHARSGGLASKPGYAAHEVDVHSMKN